MYGLRTVSSSESPQAIDLALVRRHLSLHGNTGDDLYLTSLVVAAMESAAEETHRQILTATLELALDQFPRDGQPIKLPRPRWQSTLYVKYYGADGELATWDPANYTTAGGKEPAEIWPATGKTWPATQDRPSSVLVGYVAGYGDDQAAVPTLLKHGMLLLVGHWFANREAVITGAAATELPRGVRDIFEKFAIGDDFDDYGPLRAV